MELGPVGGGSLIKKDVSIRNALARPVTVDRMKASCDCLTALPGTFTLGPGGRLTLDLSDEPLFRGLLSMEVTGLERRGGVVFRTTVNASVSCAVPSRRVVAASSECGTEVEGERHPGQRAFHPDMTGVAGVRRAKAPGLYVMPGRLREPHS